MLGEVEGYCEKKASLSADVYGHLHLPAGGHTCGSRAKVRVSRTNWETESSAVDGCRTRLTSQPLKDTHTHPLPQQWFPNRPNPSSKTCQSCGNISKMARGPTEVLLGSKPIKG